MKADTYRWLMEELAGWERDGLVTAQQAAQLQARYAAPETRRWAAVILSLFGALLIGLGVILLLAHNWDVLNREARAVVAYLPVLAALAVCARLVVVGRGGLAAREGAGVFLALSIGASIALVAQTYHLGGSFRDFTLAWMILALPAVYVLNAVAPALIYLTGITGWALGQWSYDDNPFWYWIYLAGVLPYLAWLIRRERTGLRVIALMWGVVASMGIALCSVMHGNGEPMYWFLLYAAFFAALLLAGEQWGDRSRSIWARPMTLVGGAGVGVSAWLYTFINLWRHLDRRSWYGRGEDAVFSPAGWVALIVFIVTAVALLVEARRRREWALLAGGAFPLVAAVLLALYAGAGLGGLVSALLMNLYVFVWGVLLVGTAVRRGLLGLMNAGLLLLGALLAARFFDSDMSILGRGLAFIVLGALFLAANGWMLRRRRMS